MFSLTIKQVVDKLPTHELAQSLGDFLHCVRPLLPDQRLANTLAFFINGIIAAQSPIVARIAATISRDEADPHTAAARLYRFLDNQRLTVDVFRETIDQLALCNIAREAPPRLVVAIDPVNFEKPYTKELPGVSTVHKATPPDRKGNARLARGYPAITATIVNTRVPTTTYANWFSYELDFISQNKEITYAIDHTTALLAGHAVRFVGDAGFDDQKMFAHFAAKKTEFVIRVCHHDRVVEVYNERTRSWEVEKLLDLTAVVPYLAGWHIRHNHARKVKEADVQAGWFKIRLSDRPEQELWVLVVEDTAKAVYSRPLVLITNVVINDGMVAAEVYNDWRLRPKIEDGYRFDQEQGLDVEDMRLQSLEGMCKMFMLVLIAAEFIFYLLDSWPPQAILWVRQLGGKMGVSSDRDGPYVFLWGLVAFLQTLVTLSHLSVHPFPHHAFLEVGKCV